MTDHKVGIFASVMILCGTLMGAGILAFPYAFSLVGLNLGLIITLISLLCGIYALRLLIRLAFTLNVNSYEELGSIIYAKHGANIVALLMFILTFGCLVAYLDIIADASTFALDSLLDDNDHFYAKREFILIISLTFILIPLCLLKNISQLEKASYIAVGILCIFALFLVIYSIVDLITEGHKHREPGEKIQFFNLNWNIFESLSIICLAFAAPSSIFPIYHDLKNATYNRMSSVIIYGLLIAGIAYMLTGYFGYVVFGQNVAGDVLNSLPEHPAIFNIIRIILCIAMIFHYPIIHFGLREALFNSIFADYNELSNTKYILITLLANMLALFIALLLPDLDSIFSLTGALSGFPLVYILPCLFYIKIHTYGSTAFEEVTRLVVDGDKHSSKALDHANNHNKTISSTSDDYDVIEEADEIEDGTDTMSNYVTTISSSSIDKNDNTNKQAIKVKKTSYELKLIYVLLITSSITFVGAVYSCFKNVIEEFSQ